RGVIREAQLDLEWIDPLAADLDEVISPAAEEMKSLGVAHEPVAGVDPAALTHRLPRLVRAVPVAGRICISANPQDAFLAIGHVVPAAVAKDDLVAGHALAGRTGFLGRGGVRKVDVQGLARPQAFHDLQTGDLLPGMEDFGCENFG